MRELPTDEGAASLLRMQQAAAQSVLSLYGRVNAGSLRGKPVDRIGELLKEIEGEETGRTG